MKTFFLTAAKALGIMTAVGLVNACANMPNANYGVSVMNRTIPERIIDEGIERVALKNLPNVAGLENMNEQSLRVVIDSFRREVLLTGEVPNEQIKINIHNMIASMKDVVRVHNYLTVAAIAKGQSHTLHENFLKSKIRTRIMAGRTIKNSQYKLVVRNDVVYILGYLTPTQQNTIVEAIRFTTGIERAVLLANLVTHDGIPISANDIMTDTVPYADDNSDGAVYGGLGNTTNSYQPPPPPTNTKPKNLVESSVIKMEKKPSTGYVQLYNGTDKP